MKKGDIVTINDTSYTRTVGNGQLVYPGHSLRYKQCVIVELDCIFPKTSPWNGDNFNNAIVQVHETGQVIFIEERFLEPVPPKHKIMIDITNAMSVTYGDIIEISDKLYKEIKRDSQM